eukprot:gene303-63_t
MSSSAADADADATVRAVKLALFFPFSCGSLIKAHENCAAARDAMDACVEQSERRRFYLDQQCSRWKRLHQSCILSGIADCDQQLSKLHSCILEADA